MISKFWQNKRDYALIVLAAIIIIFLAIFISRSGGSNSPQTTSQNNSLKVAVNPSGMKYPSGWHEALQIPQSDKQANVVSEAGRSNPSATAILSIKNGELDKAFDISKLPDQTIAKLKSSRDSFVLVKSSFTTVSKNKSVLINYKDSSGDLTYEHTQLIVPTTTKIYYLTITAKASDYPSIQKDVNDMMKNLADYISSH